MQVIGRGTIIGLISGKVKLMIRKNEVAMSVLSHTLKTKLYLNCINIDHTK